MRMLLTGAIFVLASCASNTETTALENRVTSWTGSSVHELANVLGEPTLVTEDSWEWRLTGPGMQAATSTSSLPRQLDARDRNTETGLGSSWGTGGNTGTKSADTSIPRKECVYRATIDGNIIVDLETVTVSGRCKFGEIPLRGRNLNNGQS